MEEVLNSQENSLLGVNALNFFFQKYKHYRSASSYALAFALSVSIVAWPVIIYTGYRILSKPAHSQDNQSDQLNSKQNLRPLKQSALEVSF